ncbi:MAG: ribosome maturation factor RimP [Steroidobacteraceae bacterium]
MVTREGFLRLLERVVDQSGYELVEVEYRAPPNALLRLYIDRRDDLPVAVEDCETVSRAVSELLDAADPIERAYDLEVSSPGFDRPLRTIEHFRRFLGQEARLELSEPLEGRRRFKGRLTGLEGEEWIEMEVDGRAWRLPLGLVTKARLVA